MGSIVRWLALLLVGCGVNAVEARTLSTHELTLSGPRVIGGMVWITAVRRRPGEEAETLVITCPPSVDEEALRVDGVIANACQWQPLVQTSEPATRVVRRREAARLRRMREAEAEALAESMQPSSQSHSGELTDSDTVDSRSQATIDKYFVDSAVGWTIEINMTSVFDNYLELRFEGRRVAFNDDHNGLNARISYRAAQTGRYEIHARGLATDARGTYQLQIDVRRP